MAAPPQAPRGIISGINVTPLVDITLVLLIIFIVTAKIVVTPGVAMDLPKASQATEVQVIFSVLLPTDGTTWVNGTRLGNDELLVRQARQALSENRELRAVIQADGSVPHRRVIAVIDALKRAGVERIAFGAVAESLPATRP